MNRIRRLWAIAGILIVLALITASGALFLLDTSPANAANSVLNALNLQEDEESDRPITGEALEKASAAALEFTGGGQVTDTEVGDEEGYYEAEVSTASGEVDVHLDENFNVISQEQERDDIEDEDEAGDGSAEEDAAEGEDTPVTGSALDEASAAALIFTGGGRVTDTEVGDEEGYYEIEVTLEDGSQVDVHLDENFNVIGQEAEGAEDEND